MRVFSIATPTTDSGQVRLSLLIKSGPVFESKDKKGISHLLEHLVIAAKDKFSPYKDIHHYLNFLECEFGAIICKEYVVYSFSVPQKNLKQLAVFLSKFLAVDFELSDLKREKQILMEEIDELRDNNPRELFVYLRDKRLFNQHPLANDFFGEKDIIKNITTKQLKDYHNNTYCYANIVLGLMGNKSFEKDVQFSLQKDKISRGEQQKELIEIPRFRLPHFKPFEVIKISNPVFKRAHIAFDFLIQEKLLVEEELMLILIQGLLEKLLFERLRESLGLIYGVDSSLYRYFLGGITFLELHTESQPSNVPRIIKESKIILNNAHFSTQLFNFEKDNLEKAFWKIHPDEILEWTASRILYEGKAATPEERQRALKGITPKKFEEFYSKIFSNYTPVIFVGSPD